MTLRDATLLATTKFKTRKIRSILVVLGTSFLTALVLILSLTFTGIKHSIGSDISPLAKQNLVQIYDTNDNLSDSPTGLGQSTVVNEESLTKALKLDKDQVQHISYTRYLSQKPLQVQTIDNEPQGGSIVISLDDFPKGPYADFGFGNSTDSSRSIVNIGFLDDNLLTPLVASGQTLEPKDGVLPVLISMDFLNNKYEDQIKEIHNASDIVDKQNEIQSMYLGKVVSATLSSSDNGKITQDTPSPGKKVKVRIVGFLSSSRGLISGFQGTFDSPIIASYSSVVGTEFESLSEYTVPGTFTVYASFKTYSAKQEYLKSSIASSQFATGFGNISDPIRDITESIRNILVWLVILLIIFVTIPMAGTLGKVLSDSKRETGVFRAIGARNSDIALIYAMYCAILALVAFVVAAFVASAVTIILTLIYGSKLSAQLTVTSGSTKIIPVSLFGIDMWHWLILLGLLIIAAILGAVIPVLRTLRKDPILAMRDE